MEILTVFKWIVISILAIIVVYVVMIIVMVLVVSRGLKSIFAKETFQGIRDGLMSGNIPFKYNTDPGDQMFYRAEAIDGVVHLPDANAYRKRRYTMPSEEALLEYVAPDPGSLAFQSLRENYFD